MSLRSLQAKRAALHHRVESHRAKAIQLFEKAAAEHAMATQYDRDLALLDREINAIVDTSLDRMTTVHRETYSHEDSM